MAWAAWGLGPHGDEPTGPQARVRCYHGVWRMVFPAPRTPQPPLHSPPPPSPPFVPLAPTPSFQRSRAPARRTLLCLFPVVVSNIHGCGLQGGRICGRRLRSRREALPPLAAAQMRRRRVMHLSRPRRRRRRATQRTTQQRLMAPRLHHAAPLLLRCLLLVALHPHCLVAAPSAAQPQRHQLRLRLR